MQFPLAEQKQCSIKTVRVKRKAVYLRDVGPNLTTTEFTVSTLSTLRARTRDVSLQASLHDTDQGPGVTTHEVAATFPAIQTKLSECLAVQDPVDSSHRVTECVDDVMQALSAFFQMEEQLRLACCAT